MEKTSEQKMILVECAECDNTVEISVSLFDNFIAAAIPVRCHECYFKFEMAQVKAESPFKFGV